VTPLPPPTAGDFFALELVDSQLTCTKAMGTAAARGNHLDRRPRVPLLLLFICCPMLRFTSISCLVCAGLSTALPLSAGLLCAALAAEALRSVTSEA